MNYRPRCQHCKSHGSQQAPFLTVTLDADWAGERGLDPKRTTRMGFVCKVCGQTFPAVTYRQEAPAGRTPLLGAELDFAIRH